MKDFYEIGGAMYITGIHYMTAMPLISHLAEYAGKMVGVDKATTAFKGDRNVRALSQFLNTTCTNRLQLPGSNKSVTCNLLDKLRSMYQPTTTRHMSTPEETLPTDNITEDSSDNSSTSSCSSTSTQLQIDITTKRTRKLPQTTDDHI